MILSIDVGDKRVGLAISDQSKTVARPLETVDRAQSRAENRILELIQKYSISLLLVGLPLDHAGKKTSQCEKVENFCRRLQRRTNTPIEYRDEYLTSVEAEARLKASQGRNLVATKKGLVDSMSACILLQAFLDER